MQDVRRRYAHMLRATVHKVLCRGSPHTQSQTPLVFVLSPCSCRVQACKRAAPALPHAIVPQHIASGNSCVVQACFSSCGSVHTVSVVHDKPGARAPRKLRSALQLSPTHQRPCLKAFMSTVLSRKAWR